MKTRAVTLVVLGMFVFSCAPKIVTPIAEEKKGLTPELAEGKSMYENNCAKCHNLKNPNEYTAEEWQPIMIRMQKKAKITDVEREKIYKYVTYR